MWKHRQQILILLTFGAVFYFLNYLIGESVEAWCKTLAEYIVSREEHPIAFDIVGGGFAGVILVVFSAPAFVAGLFIWKRLRPGGDGKPC